MRTDENRNPTAFTTDVARDAGLAEGVEYERGTPFVVDEPNGQKITLYTAKLLLNPIETTLKVLDAAGFYTKHGAHRWTYIGIPSWIWQKASREDKVRTIGFMYENEGGTAMRSLFPSWLKGENMQKLTYYYQRYPYPALNGHITLAGEMRAFLDGVHFILDRTVGSNPTQLDGALLQQIQPASVLSGVAQLGENARNPLNGTPLDAGQTIDGLIALYQREGRTLLAAYNRNR